MLNIVLFLNRESKKIDEFDDRIEFCFCASKMREFYVENIENPFFNDIILRWDGEKQDSWSFLEKLPNEKKLDLKAIVSKDKLIKSFPNSLNNEGVKQYFFIKEDFFKANFLELVKKNALLDSSPLYQNEKTIVWLGFSELSIYSDKLIIKDVITGVDCDFVSSDSIKLPSNEQVKSQVHFIGQDQYKCDLSRYRLPESCIVNELTTPIFEGYEKLLATCLVKEFISEEKVIISGIKKLSLELASNDSTFDKANISILEKAVSWVYEERTEVRILLLTDRVSLDIPDGSALLPSIYTHLERAIEQAKDKYEFVIKDRKEAHAKELADLYKDIKTTTDAYSKSAGELVSGLLKDALSAIFVLSIMLFSRLIGKEELLNGDNIHWLFKFLAIYLIVAPIVRIGFEWFSLGLNKKDLLAWKDTTRNHLSHRELKDIINSRVVKHRRFYIKGASTVIILSLMLSIFAWNLPNIMSSPTKASGNITHKDLLKFYEKNRPLLIGPQGTKGETGSSGPKGETGLRGPKGERGLRGYKGKAGLQGISGEKGKPGDAGIEGEVGSFISITVS